MKNEAKPAYELRERNSSLYDFQSDLKCAEGKIGLLAYNIVTIAEMGIVATGLIKLLSQ
jgi:hypothetical protein